MDNAFVNIYKKGKAYKLCIIPRYVQSQWKTEGKTTSWLCFCRLATGAMVPWSASSARRKYRVLSENSLKYKQWLPLAHMYPSSFALAYRDKHWLQVIFFVFYFLRMTINIILWTFYWGIIILWNAIIVTSLQHIFNSNLESFPCFILHIICIYIPCNIL